MAKSPKREQRPTTQLSAALLRLAQGLALGAVSGLGRPGCDLAPAYLLGVLGLAYFSIVEARWQRAVCVALGWSVGMGTLSGLGAYSWGLDVVAFIVSNVFLYAGLSLSLLCRACRRTRSTMGVFVFAFCAWSVWLWAWESTVLGNKFMASALLRVAPAWVASARLIGINVVDALLMAGVVAGAHRLVMTRNLSGARWRRAAGAVAPIAVSLSVLALLGVLARSSAAPSVGSVSVGIPQINVESTYYSSRLTAPQTVAIFRQRLSSLLARLDEPELIVFTEGFDGGFPWSLAESRRAWQGFAATRQQHLVLTSFAVSERGWKANAAGGIRADGSIAGEHLKVDLAPFGEAPFEAGSHFTPLELGPELRAGALICLESILPQGPRALVRQGAQLLTTSTSDITFGSSVTTFEHLAATQLRAIEAGRSIVWASNAGPSGVIARFGVLTAPGPFRQPAAVLGRAELYSDVPLFLRTEQVWPLLAALGLAALGFRFWRARATSSPDLPASSGAPALAGKAGALSRRRHSALVTALVTWTVLCWVLSPALVEARHGDARRSWMAVTDIFAPKLPLMTTGLERFASDNSAAAAARYFLEYYGADPELAQDVPSNISTLEQLHETLSASGIPTRELDFTSGVPRVASLVRLEDGHFAVSIHANGTGPVVLAVPALGRVLEMPAALVTSMTGGRGLVPNAP